MFCIFQIGDEKQHSFQPLINCGRISDEILQRPRARFTFLVFSGFILVAPNIVPYFYESSALLAFYVVNLILAIFIALHVFDRRIAFLVATSWDFLYLGGICLVFSSSTIYQTVLNTNLAGNINSFAPHWVAGIVLLQIATSSVLLLLYVSDAAIALSKWHKIVLFGFSTAFGIGFMIFNRLNVVTNLSHPVCILYFVCADTQALYSQQSILGHCCATTIKWWFWNQKLAFIHYEISIKSLDFNH